MRYRRAEVCLFTLAAIFALAGLTDAIYLTVGHLTGQFATCVASSGCEAVLRSEYAAIGKVPVAAFGAAAYFTAFSLATLAAFGHERARPFFLFLVGGMLAATCWFLYVQAFLLKAFCDYCLLSATLTGLLSAIAVVVFFLAKRRMASSL